MMTMRTGLQSTAGILWVAIVMAIAGLVLPRPLMAQYPGEGTPPDQERRFFEETGFWVSGAFLTYFDAHNGLETFGYPISAPYNEHGVLVQYFQKARMEWHPLNPDPYKLQLGLLGEELGFRRPAVPRSRVSPGKVYFAETGHNVTYMFLRYFRKHGGIDVFGYPITEMLVEDQKIVQYFQRLKLIWDPRTGTMSIGDLGELYVNAHRDRFPPDVLRRGSYRVGGQEARDLQVLVGMAHAIVGVEQGQLVRVLVNAVGTEQPIPGAQVQITLRAQTGMVFPDSVRTMETDDRGSAEFLIPLDDVAPGTWVVLRIDVTDGRVSKTQEELFLVWY